MARQSNGGFMAGVLLGGLVGAALALPRDAPWRSLGARGDERAGAENAEVALERGRDALRARFEQATVEAQHAANETEQRLEAEYRGARDGS